MVLRLGLLIETSDDDDIMLDEGKSLLTDTLLAQISDRIVAVAEALGLEGTTVPITETTRLGMILLKVT